MSIELSYSTALGADADEVWAHATQMEGVNYELMPLARMTAPARWRRARLDQAPLGEEAFASYILVAGLIPVDRHRLRLVELGPERRFLERSSSLHNRLWQHERTVEPVAARRCTVTDRLAIEPRLAVAAPLVRRVAGLVFSHRHGRLIRRFGSD